jgi:hypothetical protein
VYAKDEGVSKTGRLFVFQKDRGVKGIWPLSDLPSQKKKKGEKDDTQ